MAKSGIHIKPSKKGTLHKALGIPEGENIPASKLKDKPGDSPAMKKKKNFARNAKKWKKGQDGLELPQPPEWLKNFQEPYPSFPGFQDDNTLAPVTVINRNTQKLSTELAPIEKPMPMVNKTLDKGPQLQIAQNTPQEKNKFDWGWLNSDNLLTGLSVIDALIPGRKNKTNYLTPADQIWSNPNPYGTDSSALMKDGGKLSSEKAKEMLRDGTANGKKLTKKQKKYFQAVAHGMTPKAPDGVIIPPTKKPATDSVNPLARRVNKITPIFSTVDATSQSQGFQNYASDETADRFLHSSHDTFDQIYNAHTTKRKEFEDANAKINPIIDTDVSNSLKLTQGKFKGANVNKELINQLVTAAKKQGIDPWDMLALAGQESTFKADNRWVDKTASRFTTDRESVVSGWDLYNDNAPYEIGKFLADNKVPGIHEGKSSRGYSYEFNEEDIRPYLNKHPELAEKYRQKLASIKNPEIGIFEKAAQQIKTKGFKSYNPGDKDYVNKISNSKKLLQSDPELKKYVSTIMKNGGKIYGNNGLMVEGGQASQISPSFTQFEGPSHANGGIDIAYGSSPVEVEGQEMFSVSPDGTGVVWGNMTVPGTKMKFKTAGKKLANKENKAIKQDVQGNELLEDNNPANRFERLSYNAGILKTKGAEAKLGAVHEQKEFLANLQQSMLDVAEYNNLDPEAMSNGKKKKAKKGTYLKAENGKSIAKDAVAKAAEKYGIPASVLNKIILQESGYNTSAISNRGAKGIMQFMPATAKSMGLSDSQLTSSKKEDIEANIDAGAKYLSQLRNQNNGDLILALAAYNGGQKAVDFVKSSTGKKSITGQDFIDFYSNRRETSPTDKKNAWQNQTLDYVNNIMDINPGETEAQVEKRLGGFRGDYYTNPNSSSPALDPIVFPEAPSWLRTFEDNPTAPTSATPTTGGQTPPTYDWDFSVPVANPPSNITPLRFEQYAPELYGIATNRPSFVPAQKYTPQLFQPYQVSFQDRINENNYAFNALEDTLSDNPSALSSLSAQLYNANNSVRGEEFRTNQAINNEIINKNIALGNEAQMQNLQILDNQYLRQEQARANTKRDTQTILNSLSSKVLQHDFENRTLAAYENMSNYRMVDTNNDGIPDRAMYFGPEYTPPEANSTGMNYNAADQTQEINYRNYPESSVRRDAFGIPIQSTTKDEYRPINRGYRKMKRAGGNLQKKFNEQYGRK